MTPKTKYIPRRLPNNKNKAAANPSEHSSSYEWLVYWVAHHFTAYAHASSGSNAPYKTPRL